MSAEPYELKIDDCSGCPFDTYNGGSTSCTHPFGQARGIHLSVQPPELGVRDGCPLASGLTVIVKGPHDVQPMEERDKALKRLLKREAELAAREAELAAREVDDG